MNEDNKPIFQPKPVAESTSTTDVDDDFENEPLGERQEEACSLEEGCESCQ